MARSMYEIDLREAMFGQHWTLANKRDETKANEMLEKIERAFVIPSEIVKDRNSFGCVEFCQHIEKLGVVGVGIRHVWVSPKHRRKGYGRLLMIAACKAADETCLPLYGTVNPYHVSEHGKVEYPDNARCEQLKIPNPEQLTEWYMREFDFQESKHSYRIVRFPKDNR